MKDLDELEKLEETSIEEKFKNMFSSPLTI